MLAQEDPALHLFEVFGRCSGKTEKCFWKVHKAYQLVYGHAWRLGRVKMVEFLWDANDERAMGAAVVKIAF